MDLLNSALNLKGNDKLSHNAHSNTLPGETLQPVTQFHYVTGLLSLYLSALLAFWVLVVKASETLTLKRRPYREL